MASLRALNVSAASVRATSQSVVPFVPACTSTLPARSNVLQVSACAPRWNPVAPRMQPLRAVDESQSDASSMEEPETAQDANTAALKLTAAGRWAEALDLFERALTLPGTGMKRFRDKPRVASDREKMTALYNIACCHSQLKDARSGLVALAGCLELGYADFPQIRRDPDLVALRADERFEGLMKRFEPSGMTAALGFNLGNIFGRK